MLRNTLFGYGFMANRLLGAPGAFASSFGHVWGNLPRNGTLGTRLSRSFAAGRSALRGYMAGTMAQAFGTDRSYGLGAGLAIGTPLIAGAAAFSGLANLRRGRYLRGAAMLAAGAGLAGLMYGSAAHYRNLVHEGWG